MFTKWAKIGQKFSSQIFTKWASHESSLSGPKLGRNFKSAHIYTNWASHKSSLSGQKMGRNFKYKSYF